VLLDFVQEPVPQVDHAGEIDLLDAVRGVPLVPAGVSFSLP
jgi:hypothetical protein